MTGNSSGIASHIAGANRSVRLTSVKNELSVLISNGRIVVVGVNRAVVRGQSFDCGRTENAFA